MRRALRRQLVLATAGVMIAALGALEIGKLLTTEQSGIDIEGARRAISYDVPSAEGQWVRFPVPPGRTVVRMTTNALFEASAIAELPRPVRGRYVLEYRITSPIDDDVEPTLFHETATLPATTPRIVSADPGVIPAPGQTVQFEVDGRAVIDIWLRVAEADPAIDSVAVRVNARETIPAADADVRWRRLSRSQQARLFRGSLYPPEMARREERIEVASDRWSPLGPEGVTGRDYQVRILYLIGEDEDDEDPGSGVLLAYPGGLPISAASYGVVPIPPGGGLVQINFEPVASTPSSAIVALQWLPRGVGLARFFRLDLDQGQARFEQRLDEGTVVAISPVDLVLTASLVNEDAEDLDITPTPPVAAGWRIDSAALGWVVTHDGNQPTPIRLDLRPLADAAGQTGVTRYTIEMLSDQGNPVRTETIEAGFVHDYFVRLLDSSRRLGESTRRYLQVPSDVASIRVSSDGPAIASLFARPAELPYLTRVPIDYFTYPVQPPAPALWFAQRPENADTVIRSRGRELFAVSPVPTEADPDLVSGQYSWQRLSPQTAAIGRELLLARDGRARVRDEALASWFRPLASGSTQLQIRAPTGVDAVEPQLIWESASRDPGELILQVSGMAEVRAPLAGRQGSLTLPPMVPGRYDMDLVAPSGVEVWISHAGRGTGVNRLRRFALRLDGHRGFRFSFDKSRPETSVTFSLHQPVGADMSTDVSVQLLGVPARGVIENDFTATRRVFSLSPDFEVPEAIVLGRATERVDSGTPFFFRLGEDVPPGLYTLDVAFPDGATGYLSVYSIEPGSTVRSGFLFERGVDNEVTAPDE